jgi:hypothetical protein
VSKECGFEGTIKDAVQLSAVRFFSEDVLSTIYDVNTVFTLIYRVAKNAIFQESDSDLRWNRKHQFIESEETNLDDMRSIDDFSIDIVERISREKSGQELMRRIELAQQKGVDLGRMSFPLTMDAELAANNTIYPVCSTFDDMKSEAKGKKHLSEYALELRKIREEIHYQVGEFARALNRSHDKISASLYGRVEPDLDLMKDARALYLSCIADAKRKTDKYKQFGNMNEIVEFWMSSLGLSNDRSGEESLAKTLGINHSTIFRWRKNAYKPSMSDLERYSSYVEAIRPACLVASTSASNQSSM